MEVIEHLLHVLRGNLILLDAFNLFDHFEKISLETLKFILIYQMFLILSEVLFKLLDPPFDVNVVRSIVHLDR